MCFFPHIFRSIRHNIMNQWMGCINRFCSVRVACKWMQNLVLQVIYIIISCNKGIVHKSRRIYMVKGCATKVGCMCYKVVSGARTVVKKCVKNVFVEFKTNLKEKTRKIFVQLAIYISLEVIYFQSSYPIFNKFHLMFT